MTSFVDAYSVPKTLDDNLVWRANLRIKAESDPALQSALADACAKDVLFLFNGFLMTYDTRTKQKHLPFITWPFQDKYILDLESAIDQQYDLLTEKSRDMGATWMMLGVFLHRWRFHREHFLTGSRTEKLVDYLGDMDTHFERLRYMLQALPTWMMPKGWDWDKHSKYMELMNPEGGNAILGQAMSDEFSRQGRYRAILADEFAFIDHAPIVWQAMGDSTHCRLPVSTPSPEGRANFFAAIRFSGKTKVVTLHWKSHPKKDDNWYKAEEARRLRKEEMAREVDIDYQESAASRIVIHYAWVTQAMLNPQAGGPNTIIIACDPARFGDDETVIYVLKGYRIIEKITLDYNTTMQAAGHIARLMNERKGNAAVIDVIGLGAGVVDRLTEQGYPVIPFNSAETSTFPTAYANMRAEMWWEGAKLFKEGVIAIDPDDELVRQLTTPRYNISSSGKITIEPKDELKKPDRLGKSPDRADALLMGLWAQRAFAAHQIVSGQEMPDTVTSEEAGLGRVEIGQSI